MVPASGEGHEDRWEDAHNTLGPGPAMELTFDDLSYSLVEGLPP